MILPVLLAACGAPPAGIPDQPGTATAGDLPVLLAVSSPDLPVAIYLAVRAVMDQDFRECPAIYATGSNVSAVAGEGCRDTAGIEWVGQASASYSGGTYWYSLANFGPKSGLAGAWVGNGLLGVTITDHGNFTFDSDLALDTYDEAKRVFWTQTVAHLAFSEDEGIPYVDGYSGKIGLDAWGTAEVQGRRVALGSLNECGYARHGSGDIGLTGANTAQFTFDHGGELPAGPPVPPAEGEGEDTGTEIGGDTGNVGDSGDTGGGGGGGGGGPNDTGIPTLSSGICGDCAAGFVAGTEVSSCVSPEREIAFPFPAPF